MADEKAKIPVIDSIAPLEAQEGDSITIVGQNLTSCKAVLFGAQTAEFKADKDGKIIVKVPATTARLENVAVKTAEGTAHASQVLLIIKEKQSKHEHLITSKTASKPTDAPKAPAA